eukprot:Skav219686  [mRNA]  locus=scaffold817:101979:106503:- [translate_table: standard]
MDAAMLTSEVAPPGPGELRIRMVADRSGGPRILGIEAAAIVEDVGEGVEDFQPGDHVITCCHPSGGRCSSSGRVDRWVACRGVMKDSSKASTRFSYGSTEIFHFHGVSAFSDAPLEKLCLLGGGVAASLGMVWQIAQPSPGAISAIFGLNAEGLAVARALHMAKAQKPLEGPTEVAFDLLGYDASVQEAMSAPWAQSFAMSSTACSTSSADAKVMM